MAKIDVYTSEMSALSARLKSISSVIENAEQVTGKVQSNLDFQVAAKADIAGGLSRTRKQLRQQKDKVVKMSNLTTASEVEFRNADSQMNKSTRNILGKIVTSVTGMIKGVNQLFINAVVSHYKTICSIFMPAGTIITVTGIMEMISRMAKFVNGAKENGNGTAVASGVIGEVSSGIATTSVEAPASEPEGVNSGNGNLKPYQCNDSNYSVVNCFDPEYLLNQHSYDIYNSKGKNCGCMACGVAMMQYMRTGKEINPEKDSRIWNDKTKETQWTFIEKVPNSSKRTVDDQLKILYDNLNEGTPVMIALSAKNSLSSTHSVVVVGIRQGADINNLQKSDFLVADPNGGVVRTIEEAEAECGKIMREGDNYVMWKANNKSY